MSKPVAPTPLVPLPVTSAARAELMEEVVAAAESSVDDDVFDNVVGCGNDDGGGEGATTSACRNTRTICAWLSAKHTDWQWMNSQVPNWIARAQIVAGFVAALRKTLSSSTLGGASKGLRASTSSNRRVIASSVFRAVGKSRNIGPAEDNTEIQVDTEETSLVCSFSST